MRIIARFEKGEGARYISHLDVQRLFQRAFRRAGIPMAYSQGFNPHPQLSFATALTLGATSSAEWLDIKLDEDMDPREFTGRVNDALPPGFLVHEAMIAGDKQSLSALMESAEYEAALRLEGVEREELERALAKLLSGPIMAVKKTKAGMKETDLRPQLYSVELDAGNLLRIVGRLDASGSLSIDLLMGAYGEILGAEIGYLLHRKAIYFQPGYCLPVRPQAVDKVQF